MYKPLADRPLFTAYGCLDMNGLLEKGFEYGVTSSLSEENSYGYGHGTCNSLGIQYSYEETSHDGLSFMLCIVLIVVEPPLKSVEHCMYNNSSRLASTFKYVAIATSAPGCWLQAIYHTRILLSGIPLSLSRCCLARNSCLLGKGRIFV